MGYYFIGFLIVALSVTIIYKQIKKQISGGGCGSCGSCGACSLQNQCKNQRNEKIDG